MNDISVNISDHHRVQIDNFFVDVTLFEGLEDFYVSPINVREVSLQEELLQENVEDKSRLENVEECPEEIMTDDIIFDPIEESKEESMTTVEVPILEEIIPKPYPTEIIEEIPKTPKQVSINVKPKVIFKCDQCKKQYLTLPSLDMHRFKCHKIPLPANFKQRPKLDITNEKDIYYGLDLQKTCEYCFQECSDPDDLKSHVDSFHKEFPRKYTCKVCLREFKTRETLRTHFLIVHSDERRDFKCQHCDKIFFHKRSLQNHEEIQHLGINAGRFICDICGQKSNSRGDLNRHRLRHDKIKAHECPYQECGKR